MCCEEQCRDACFNHLVLSSLQAEVVGNGADMRLVAAEATVEHIVEKWSSRDLLLSSCRRRPGIIISGNARAATSARHGPAGHMIVAASIRPLHSPAGHMLAAATALAYDSFSC